MIFAGYALGGAPGFAVGALTALVSNFWFGQGPWTPWQMAGWGLCGVLGAACSPAGRATSAASRLAAACGFAGIRLRRTAELLADGDLRRRLSVQRFLALESRAVPFDVAHAIGNVVFALVAGPAMLRMLVRFRERFEWRAPHAGAGRAAAGRARCSARVLARQAQAAPARPGGRLARLGPERRRRLGQRPADASSTSITGWAMLGLEAAGRNPLDVSRAAGPRSTTCARRSARSDSSGDFARTILALEGAGVDPRSFGGRNLVARWSIAAAATAPAKAGRGRTAYAVLALRAAGDSGGLDTTLSWLADVQNSDGGWGDERGKPSTPDNTGAVMQAIPERRPPRGLSYLRNHQHDDGGFATGGNGAVNTQSRRAESFAQPSPARFAIGGRRHGRHARHRRARAVWRRPAQRPPRPRGSQSSSGSPKEETEGQI